MAQTPGPSQQDVYGGTIWQDAVCHVGELALPTCEWPDACQPSPLLLLGPEARVAMETGGLSLPRGDEENGRRGSQVLALWFYSVVSPSLVRPRPRPQLCLSPPGGCGVTRIVAMDQLGLRPPSELLRRKPLSSYITLWLFLSTPPPPPSPPLPYNMMYMMVCSPQALCCAAVMLSVTQLRPQPCS
ncbi:unnamed protein product [Pleuronectes platessa]|uniref:Uncharacterized protein n=1 Tax=Pleuronectes platessa TaxID=8262 RepID=A0A9N7Z7A3_PLEPL|nr:unnamed protein product [Pleuronectes platessa]